VTDRTKLAILVLCTIGCMITGAVLTTIGNAEGAFAFGSLGGTFAGWAGFSKPGDMKP
jgi:hypothetical protein